MVHDCVEPWGPSYGVTALCALLGAPLLLAWLVLAGAPPAIGGQWFVPVHTAVEVVAVAMAAVIFVTGWHVHVAGRRGPPLLLSCAFLTVAVLDVAHLLTCPGVTALATADELKQTSLFWLSARLAAACGLLAHAFDPRVPTSGGAGRRGILTAGALGFAVAVIAAVMEWGDALPDTTSGDGPNSFLIALESVLVLLLAVAIGLLWRNRATIGYTTPLLLAGTALMLFCSGFFLLYRQPDDLANLAAHASKVLAYLLVYRAIFVSHVHAPLQQLARARQQADAESQHFRLLLDASPDAVIVVGVDGRIERCNAATAELFGHTPEVLVGASFEMLLPLRNRDTHRAHRRRYSARSRGRGMAALRDVSGLHRDGHEIPLDIALSAQTTDGRVIAFVRDMSERQRLMQRLVQQSRIDQLTGLPNRNEFGDLLRAAITDALVHRKRVALLLLDIDDFRSINDSWGHQHGDRMLVQAGERFARVALGATLARMGGDEFAVLLPGLDCADIALVLGEQVLVSLTLPFSVDGHTLFGSASIGIAIYPDDGADADTLIRHADLAVYRAKADGRGCVRRYSPSLGARISANLELQGLLRQALAEQQFELHYQPQARLADGAICGFEALLRWTVPGHGEVPPDRFIPVAEASGLILPLGRWVIGAACRQIANFTARGMSVRIAVNLSAHQLRSGDLVDTVVQALSDSGACVNLLDLELTESAMLDDPDSAVDTLRQLTALGVRIVIDDFGTGYSSLAYLRHLPVQKLKIDRSFMRDLDADSAARALVHGMVGLAHSLGVQVLAEGVETEQQRRILIDCGCDEMQGWLLSPALPADWAARLIANAVVVLH